MRRKSDGSGEIETEDLRLESRVWTHVPEKIDHADTESERQTGQTSHEVEGKRAGGGRGQGKQQRP